MARLHCRVDHEQDDVLLDAFITAMRQNIEHMTGRALVTQTWEATIDPQSNLAELALPHAPIQAVLSVSSVTAGGVTTALDTSAYRAPVGAGYVLPASAWPEQRLVVTYRAGYGNVDAVPKALCAAILLGVGDLYEHREAGVERAVTENPAFLRLLAPYRAIGV
jgi:uncharacterized phiE125 gp8 family phage protein